MSSYEKLRKENLQRNEAFLEKIGIADTKKRLNHGDEVPVSSQREHKTSRIKRHKMVADSEPFIPRRSSRSNNTPIENAEPLPPPVDKRIKPLANLLLTDEDFEEISTSQLLNSLVTDEQMPFTENASLLTAKEYEQSLRILFNSPGGSPQHGETQEKKKAKREEESSKETFAPLTVHQDTTTEGEGEGDAEEEKHHFHTHKERSREDISKVTKTRMTELLFHPCTHKTVLVAGDHTGHVGLWDTTATTTTTHFLCRPHTASVSGVHVFATDPSTLWSASIDKTIRKTDLEQEQFVEIYRSDASIRSTVFVSPNLLYAAGDKGNVHAVDPRGKPGSAGWVQEAHDKNIHAIRLHPQREHCLLTSTGGTSGSIAFHDTRMTGKKAWQPLVQLDNCHDDRINTVSISPDGEYMVSVAQDDTLNTWQCEEVLNKSNLTPHRRVYFANNNDNRKWLSSLRPVFDPKQPHTFAIGSMEVSRGFNMFTLGGGRTDTRHIKSVINYCDEKTFLDTHCPRVACHPSEFVMAAGNSSGKVYLLR